MKSLSRFKSNKQSVKDGGEENNLSVEDSVTYGNPNIVSFANESTSGPNPNASANCNQEYYEVDEIDYNRSFPWIKVTFINFNFN